MGKTGQGAIEVKVHIEDIENLKTTTFAKEEKDKDGTVIDRRVITRIQFECEIMPSALSNVHYLLAADSKVHVLIGSPQAIMAVAESNEPAFAEA
jgi:porphobilinogen deaminase